MGVVEMGLRVFVLQIIPSVLRLGGTVIDLWKVNTCRVLDGMPK